MKIIHKKFLLVVFVFLVSAFSFASVVSARLVTSLDGYFEQIQILNRYGRYGECFDFVNQVSFFCDPSWKIVQNEKALILQISKNPFVQMTFAKLNKNIRFFEQMSSLELYEEENVYRDDFVLERSHLDGQKAFKVKAYAKLFPKKRLLDYYFFHNGELYGLFFSWENDEEREKYQFLVDRIIKSFNLNMDEKITGSSDGFSDLGLHRF